MDTNHKETKENGTINVAYQDEESNTELTPYNWVVQTTLEDAETKRNISSTNISNVRLFFIAVGSFVMYFCSWGMAQSFGVMFIELVEKFGGSKTETTWVSSLFSGVLLISGPVAGVLIKKYSCRFVGIVGSLVLTVGLVSSVFTPSLHVLYVTYGVVGGFGGSLLFTTAGVVVLEHFDKWRSLVIGFSESGAAVGTIVIPLMTQKCLDVYGFRGTFLLLGGLCLQCLVAALVFVPPSKNKDIQRTIDRTFPIRYLFLWSYNLLNKDNEPGKLKYFYYTTDDYSKEAINNTSSEHDLPENGKKSSCVDIKQFKKLFAFINVGYMLFAVSWAVMMLPFLVPFLFLPDAALSNGSSKLDAAYIASALGIGSVVGKVSFGFLGDVKRLETTIMHIVPIMLFGTFSLVYTYISGFTNTMILAALFGMTSAICDGIHPVITLQLVGTDHLSIGLGILYFVMSFTTILGAPIAGWIADTTGRYTETFYYCAGLSYLAAVIAMFIPIWKRRNIHNM